MRITVLPKPLRVNALFSVVQLFCLLVAFEAVKSAYSQTPANKQETPAKSQSQPEPAAVSPSVSETAIQQPQASIETKESQKEPAAFWDSKLSDWIQVGINAVLLIVVFWQARINRTQRETMKRQSVIMQGQLDAMQKAQDSFGVAERAYLIIDDLYFVGDGQHPQLLYTVHNAGRTPAAKVIGVTTAFLVNSPYTGRSAGDHGRESDLPGLVKRENLAKYHDIAMTPARWLAVKNGDATFVVRGEFHYRDFQGTDQVLPFCLGYDSDLGRFRDY